MTREDKESVLGILILVGLILVVAWAQYYWDEITGFFQQVLLITLLLVTALLVGSATIWALNKYGVINFHPLSRGKRRFQRWHLIRRLIAYRADPQKLSSATQNLDNMNELDSKVENLSLTNMAHDLKEAEDDYNRAIKRCSGSKAAEKAVKEAFIQRCARIKDKYKV